MLIFGLDHHSQFDPFLRSKSNNFFRFEFYLSKNSWVQKISRFGELFENSIFLPLGPHRENISNFKKVYGEQLYRTSFSPENSLWRLKIQFLTKNSEKLHESWSRQRFHDCAQLIPPHKITPIEVIFRKKFLGPKFM